MRKQVPGPGTRSVMRITCRVASKTEPRVLEGETQERPDGAIPA